MICGRQDGYIDYNEFLPIGVDIVQAHTDCDLCMN